MGKRLSRFTYPFRTDVLKKFAQSKIMVATNKTCRRQEQSRTDLYFAPTVPPKNIELNVFVQLGVFYAFDGEKA